MPRSFDLTRLRERYDAMLVDMDGTLLGAHGLLGARTVRAIQALQQAGMRILLCTGRSVRGTFEVHRDLALDEPVVAYNGSWIGLPGATPDQRIPIPGHCIDSLAALEAAAEFTFRCDGDYKYTVHSAHSDYRVVAEWYEHVRTVEVHELPSDEVMRFSMFFEGAPPGPHEDGLPEDGTLMPASYSTDAPHHAEWDALPDDVRASLRRESFPLRIFPKYRHSGLELSEVVGASRGKAEGVAFLEARYGIPASRVIAIGDQRNDLSMHEAAGLAIAMGNAVPELKAIADFEIGHHAEEGIAAWIEAGAPMRHRDPVE